MSKYLMILLDLSSQFKTAHWNVISPNFIAIHKLYDKIYSELASQADTVAERIRFLGIKALGDTRNVSSISPLAKYDYDLQDTALLEDLLSKLVTTSDSLKPDIIEVLKLDNSSADVLIETQRLVDQKIYLLRSHITA